MSASVASPCKTSKRHSQFSSQSTFEVNSLVPRSTATPSTNAETIQWLNTPCMDPGGKCCSAKGWLGTGFMYLPGAGKAGLSYHLPIADQRGVNPTRKTWSTHRYPIITSATFQLYQAAFQPNKTTLQVVSEAETVAEPYVGRIKRLAQVKVRIQLTIVVAWVLCLLYMCVGHQGVRTGLVLAGVLLVAFSCLVVLLNKRLRTAYEGLSASLEAFAHSKADLALRGYAVSALGPFALHITVLNRFTLSFSSPEYRQS